MFFRFFEGIHEITLKSGLHTTCFFYVFGLFLFFFQKIELTTWNPWNPWVPMDSMGARGMGHAHRPIGWAQWDALGRPWDSHENVDVIGYTCKMYLSV
jgi:hypothetical protein